MYSEARQVRERQREMLAQAWQERQAAQVRALRRASRRAERAERRLAAALQDVVRARSELVQG